MLTLNDGRNELWQWDTGRTLAVDADCSQVHFSNKVFGRSIDVDVADGVAIIPDVLLQTDKDLNVWAFVGTAENGYTKISKIFTVNRRNKPADYVFTPTDQTSLEEIKERLEYLEKNPVEVPVQSVNGQTGTVELIAEDVGAISQDDLQNATNEALAQAKASGEFDGADGQDGTPGHDGITPTIGDNGNWYIGATDTGKPSRGADGATGATGATGQKGADGKSAYQYAQDGGYTGTETEFSEKLAQEQLTGTTKELTPTQVYNAVSAGIPVKVQYTDSTYGLFSFTAFNVSESMNMIVSQIIAYYNGVYILAELNGDKSNGTWGFLTTTLAQKTDIPSALPNPNTLTFTGAVTGSYDGSAPLSVKIPSAVTDAHINSLIDTKLGVIENGAY